MSQTKNILIFAAAGAISRGVAQRFANEGHTLWLSARREDQLTEIKAELEAAGATVHIHAVDATDETAVREYVDEVRSEGGSIDVVFNGIGGAPAGLNYPKQTVESSLEDFMTPVRRILGSQFITSREAGRVMGQQGHGAIITLSATLSGMTAPHMAGITSTCGAVEAMTRSLAGDFGARGVRVNCVRGSAMPETRTIQDTFAGQARINGGSRDVAPPPLGRMITVQDTAGAVSFLASDAASGITAQVLTVCAGGFVGQG